MTIIWNQFDDSVIQKTHGDIRFYRDLYEGNHSKLFSRAANLIEKGEIVDNLTEGPVKAANVQTPYIIANTSKIIAEIPAMFISRSIGTITTSLKADPEQIEELTEETEDLIDGPKDETVNGEVLDAQQELIRQIVLNSNLAHEHWGNIVQQQVDGGLVGVPWLDERGLRIDFKQRDVYYPHEDGLGVDLAYSRMINEEEFLHIYRERVEKGNLRVSHFLYRLNGANRTEEVSPEETIDLLGIDELERVYIGRSRPFVSYWANDKTFMNPLGVSCLKGQESKQDEINWTLTRNAITFERNGKPRIAISPEVMTALQEIAEERYGNKNKIDHRDLELVTMNDQGKSMEIIQIDISKIGGFPEVKNYIKLMLMETMTSEKAIDFYMDGGGAAQSGVAKYYDLLITLMKSERIQQEYVHFLKQLIESALYIANLNDSSVRIEEPEIELSSMVPISRKELIEENALAFEKGVQSLETTIRRNNPNASEEWIQEELERLGEAEEEEAAAYPPDEDLPADEEEEDDQLPGEGE